MSNKPDELASIPADLELTGGIRGKYYDRYLSGTNLEPLTDQPGKAVTWHLEATEPFLDCLKHLPDSAAIGSSIAAALDFISRTPQAAPVVPGTRVQILKIPEQSIGGERVPALHFLYVIEHATNRIRLLAVDVIQSSMTVPHNISSQLQALFPRLDNRS